MVKFENLNTYCPYPWANLYVSTDGDISPCCVWEGKPLGNIRDSEISTILNNSRFCQVRKKMLCGSPIRGCSKCYRGEAAGAWSTRLSMLNWFTGVRDFAEKETGEDGELMKFTPIAWDIRFSNLCNLRCRMCGPQSSTAWYEDCYKVGRGSEVEYQQKNLMTKKDREKLVDLVCSSVDSLKEIYFAGGEPLIMEEHYRILEELIRKQKSGVRIRYNTNLTILQFKTWNVLDMWEELLRLGNRLEVGVSIDATGDALEYIRKGCSWEKIQENIGKLAYSNVFYFLAPTISILNVYRFLDLYRWYFDEVSNVRWSLPGVSILGYPEFYDLRILPEVEKEKIRKTYSDFMANLKTEEEILGSEMTLKAILGYLDQTVEDPRRAQKLFFAETKKLDQVRGENFLGINPEFTEWWNYEN